MQNASPDEFTPEIGAAIRQAHGGAVAKVAAERPALRRKLRERAEEYRAGGLADKAAYFEGIADAADEIAQTAASRRNDSSDASDGGRGQHALSRTGA